jgi:hypothetical protein
MDEPWLRGPVPGIIAGLQPFAHEIMFAREELAHLFGEIDDDVVWKTPGDVAAIGYHIRHCSGSTMRMLTYLRGDALSAEQLEQLKAEKVADPALGASALLQVANDALDAAMDAARSVREEDLDQPRLVGRKQSPSTVRGLFYEIAIHTSRHVGQVATTSKLLRGKQV